MVSSRILLCAEFLKNRDEKLISFKASPALPSLASHRYYDAAHDSCFNVLQSTALAGEGPTLSLVHNIHIPHLTVLVSAVPLSRRLVGLMDDMRSMKAIV